MKAIRYFVISLVFLAALVIFLYIAVNIGVSYGTPGFPLDGVIFGFLGGLVVGIPLAIGVAGFFAKHIWSLEKQQTSQAADNEEQQKVWEEEIRDSEAERQRVSRYGVRIIVCPACGTKNSLSFSNCLKCLKDLSREEPVDNPYL